MVVNPRSVNATTPIIKTKVKENEIIDNDDLIHEKTTTKKNMVKANRLPLH